MSTVKAILWFISHYSGSFGTYRSNALGVFLLLIAYIPVWHEVFGLSTFFYFGLLVIVPWSVLFMTPVIRLLKQQRYSASAMRGYIIGGFRNSIDSLFVYSSNDFFSDITEWDLTQTQVTA